MKHRDKFRGFHAGHVIASALIAGGIEDVLKVLSWPLTAALSGMLNQISKVGRFDIPSIDSPHLPLILGASGLTTGAMLVILGLCLAFWIGREPT